MIRILTDILLLIVFLGIGWIIYQVWQFLSFSRIYIKQTIVFISSQLKAILLFLYQWFQKILFYIKESLKNITTHIKQLLHLQLEIEYILKEDHLILQT